MQQAQGETPARLPTNWSVEGDLWCFRNLRWAR